MVRFSADDFVDTASYEEAINRLGSFSISRQGSATPGD